MGIDRNGIGRVAVMVLPQCGVGMEAAFDTTRVDLLSRSGITARHGRLWQAQLTFIRNC